MTATISDNAMKILQARYLVNGESVDGMFRRVANGNKNYYQLMAELKFLPNSPTLFNAGLTNGCTLSACFVFNVDDTMRDGSSSIVATRDKAIAVAKAGGGVGYYFGHIRPKGSLIRSVHRKACGPVAVLRDYHGVRQLVTQGGKRDLAQMGILDCYHPDIEEFIHCKDADPKSLESFNLSVSWTDAWVADALQDDAHSISGGRARKLWDEQVDSAWHHGCPGMFFFDRVNRDNPNIHLGLIRASNPCGETPNRSDEPCNLGSLVLPRYFLPGRKDLNWDALASDAYLATCFLDEILDRNEFPHPQITEAALLTRKLGLGVMGWADLLALLHIHYDTLAAVDLGRKVMGLINERALDASRDLGRDRGPYHGYDPDRSQADRVRNETRTSIAPTGTISLIANCSSSIEPHFALEWERTTFEGIRMKERIPVWNELDGFVPKTASEITPEWHVRHQAAFQEHTNLGVSKTINLPNDATRVDVSKAYRLMHELGCKGGTIFRDGCREEQVLVSEKTRSVFALGTVPRRRKLPVTRQSLTHKITIGECEGYLTVGLYDDGSPGEIFLRVSRQGSTVSGMMDAWAMTFSVALQYGTPLLDLCRLHAGSRFDPSGPSQDKDIPICTSIVDYVVRWLEHRFSKEDVKTVSRSFRSGHLCPDCGTETIFQAGCLTCPQPECGWNRCG